jgi:hypothetical protein
MFQVREKGFFIAAWLLALDLYFVRTPYFCKSSFVLFLTASDTCE